MSDFIFSKAAGLQPATLLKNELHVLHVLFKDFASQEHLFQGTPVISYSPKKMKNSSINISFIFIWLHHVVFYVLKIL